MDRLTKLSKAGTKYVSAIGSGCGSWGKIIERLAAYENTGLDPEDIKLMKECAMEDGQPVPTKRLLELERADQLGRVVVPPCMVGDTVYTNFAMSGWYFRDKDRPYSSIVVFVGLNGSDDMGGGLFNVVYGKHGHMMQFRFSDIGKTVFLTREEAEKALKGEQA